MKPQKERIDHYRPEGEEFDKAYTYDHISRADDTKISQQQVKSEKIIVHGGDIPRTEETEKPRYLKDHDVGRIMIEEIPEEKELLTKYDFRKQDEVKEKTCKEMETYYKVERGPTPKMKEDVVKVGRSNITDYEKEPKESQRLDDRITTWHTEKSEKDQKVIY